jgi:diguanylate cyclase (GGDEF)-like protein
MDKCEECDKKTLRQQVTALRDLIEVAKKVVSTLDLDTLLQAILESAMQYAGTPAGSVALYDEKKRELSLHAHCGLTADFVKVERWELVAGGLTEKVLLGGELLIVEDTHATPFFNNPVALKEGIRALICVPLVVKKQIVGILYLDDFVARQFDRGKLELLSILASFAALAIYNAKLHNKTKLLAITDALTGLHNHRYFQQLFAQEMGRAKRYRKPLSLIILDVDDFKKFNDSFGHAAGDRVLAAIGSIIDKTLRKVDFAFRYGGEEFVILLPETRQDSAILVADRLRERIANESPGIIADTADRGVTVSVGVAAFPENGTSREELFEVADRLLYQAKESGKNQVQSVTDGDLCVG